MKEELSEDISDLPWERKVNKIIINHLLNDVTDFTISPPFTSLIFNCSNTFIRCVCTALCVCTVVTVAKLVHCQINRVPRLRNSLGTRLLTDEHRPDFISGVKSMLSVYRLVSQVCEILLYYLMWDFRLFQFTGSLEKDSKTSQMSEYVRAISG